MRRGLSKGEMGMEIKTIDLYEYFGQARGGAISGYLTAYLHDDITEQPKKRVRPAMLVIPGGGYAMVSRREGEPIALRYLAEGFNCFVLYYDVAPHGYPEQLLEAGMAMLYLRREAVSLGIDGEHIAAVGFSAGGHLTGCIGFCTDDLALQAAFGAESARICPDALVLCYPVVTADERYYHGGSFHNFCAGRVNAADYSIETRVNRGAPPCFIWATTPDACVPAENSLMLYTALKKAGADVELHIFEKGGHGLSTADIEVCDDPAASLHARVRQWLPLSVSFLRTHGFAVQLSER